MAQGCRDDDDVVVPGYLDGFEPPFVKSPLVDGSQMLANELFWPAFLHTIGGSATAPYAFDIDPVDLCEVIDALLTDDAWPVFTVPLAGIARLHIVMRNFTDDGGVDYVLDAGLGCPSIPLAAMEGHFRGPALAWSELIAAAQQPDSDHTVAERLLLLVPVCADRDRPSAAIEIVAAALTAVGAVSDIQSVAEELLTSPRYWTLDCQWVAVDDAMVCQGSHAYRSIGNSTPGDLRLITDAFRAVGRPRGQ